jgi:hypothetical protein
MKSTFLKINKMLHTENAAMETMEPQLEIRIASPCHARWDEMKGNERARFCMHCRKHVYDLSAMSAAAATELVRAKEGRLCVRFYRRADGKLLHAEDCPVGLARHLRRVKILAGGAVSLLLTILGVTPARAGESSPTPLGSGTSIINLPPGPTMGIPAPIPTPLPAPTPWSPLAQGTATPPMNPHGKTN